MSDPRNPLEQTQVPGGEPPLNPEAFPKGHPMRDLATKLGVPSEVPASAAEGFQGAPSAPTTPQPQTGAQIASQAASRDPQAAGQRDPLSRPYVLPSGGTLYDNHDGTVFLSPMRGEQEELFAGAGDGLSATPVLRDIVRQCSDTRGIPYEQLELSDWTAMLLHIMAASRGTDELPLYPVCPHCNQQFDGSRTLAQVPCRVLRRGTAGETPTWPPSSTQDADEDLRILREMGLDGDDVGEESAEQVFVVNGNIEEPVEVVLSNGQHVGWRYLRLVDLVQAQEFAERSQNTDAKTTGAKLNRFIKARSLATVDGQRVGVLQAMRWVQEAPLPLLIEFREEMERRSFGYELSPSFRCPNGHSFRQQLPLDGAMFRRRAGSSVH